MPNELLERTRTQSVKRLGSAARVVPDVELGLELVVLVLAELVLVVFVLVVLVLVVLVLVVLDEASRRGRT